MAAKKFLRILKDELKGHGLSFKEGERVAGIKVSISFSEQRLAIFVDPCADGCGCPEHYEGMKEREETSPDTSPFGPGTTQCKARIERESHRLTDAGWKVLRYWEHDIDRSPDAVARRIYDALDKADGA